MAKSSKVDQAMIDELKKLFPDDIDESNQDITQEIEIQEPKVKPNFESINFRNINEIYLIPCSKRKNHEGDLISSVYNLSFNQTLGNCRETLIRLYERKYGPLNWKNCLPAYERYTGIIYSEEVRLSLSLNNNQVLIVSALFGVIRPSDLIPDYNLKMDEFLNGIMISNFWKNNYETCESCILNKVLKTIKHIQPNIIFINLLSKPYQNAFCDFKKGTHSPQMNYIPDLIDAPKENEINLKDKYGHYKRGYLLKRI